jgi:aryl-alcohol dehydrogenase (NADP+)
MPFFRKAFESGVNFFESSDIYAEGTSEVVLGKAVLEYGRREDVVIATRFTAPTGPGPNERGGSTQHSS